LQSVVSVASDLPDRVSRDGSTEYLTYAIGLAESARCRRSLEVAPFSACEPFVVLAELSAIG